jgi:hypothetical protein
MRQFRSIGVIVLVCAFFFIAMLQALKKYNGNFSGFLHISEQFAARNPFLNRNEDILNSLLLVRDTGYDGQFYYSMCFDPLLRSFTEDPVFFKNVVDIIPYRYTRIGYSLFTSIISNQINFPGTMVLALLFFGGFVYRINVWMILPRKLAKGLADIFRARGLFHAQNGVVIFVLIGRGRHRVWRCIVSKLKDPERQRLGLRHSNSKGRTLAAPPKSYESSIQFVVSVLANFY